MICIKTIIKEVFYWIWLSFRWLKDPVLRLRKRSNIRYLESKLQKRKDCNVSIGENWNLHLDTNILVHADSVLEIGKRVTIMDHSRIAAKNGGKLYIGNHSLIGRYCILSAWHEIIIEDNVLFSNMIWITDHQHRFDLKLPVDFSNCDNLKAIRIKSGTWIGNKVTIMQGVTIGKNCVIGANSVVTKDVPDSCVAAGVPAKIIKTAKEIGE